MKAQSIRPGAVIGGRRVTAATNGVGTFTASKSRWSAPARIVRFADGGVAHFELGTDVDVAGWAEPLPAGGVASKAIKTPPKVRASRTEWRGETVHGMRTAEHDLIARTNMFDFGRVNGTVGAARNGVGSVRDTGPSFPAQGM
jgi:hypothetical protein